MSAPKRPRLQPSPPLATCDRIDRIGVTLERGKRLSHSSRRLGEIQRIGVGSSYVSDGSVLSRADMVPSPDNY